MASPKRKIFETKCTCQACGNVWFFGKHDQLEQLENASTNCLKAYYGCCNPLLLFLPDKKIVELDRCPKCGSKAVKSEEVVHEI